MQNWASKDSCKAADSGHVLRFLLLRSQRFEFFLIPILTLKNVVFVTTLIIKICSHKIRFS